LAGWVLENFLVLFDAIEDEEAYGLQFMDAVKKWKEPEYKQWLTYNLDPYVEIDSLNRLFRASKLTGETDFVLNWLDSFAKDLSPRSLVAFNVQIAKSVFFTEVIQDEESAKSVLRIALTMHPEIDATKEEYYEYEVLEARLRLAGIIFAQFSAHDDPERKQGLVEEMKNLPNPRGAEINTSESHIGMLYANMLRFMGPALEYQRYMNQVFENCIKGLGDDDSYNDSSYLRLLAKVLSSLKGLENDALIAISAQFSILDQEVHKKSLEARASENEEEDEASKTTDKAEPKDDAESAVAEDDSTLQSPGQGAEPTTTAKEEKEEEEEEAEKEEEYDDQDLVGDEAGICCDGCGENDMDKWEQTYYLCLVCPNTDLCVECHNKKRSSVGTVSLKVSTTTAPTTEVLEPTAEKDEAVDSAEANHKVDTPMNDVLESNGEEQEDATEGKEPTEWRKYCDSNHRFIRGPIKGWKGVKDGVIRIEGRQDLTVKEWLEGLSEKRWPAAWKQFWRGDGGLRDINEEE
jgi:hypothetical protein